MGKKLSEYKPKANALIRTLWFPDGADSTNGIPVRLQYLAPERFAEIEKQVTIRLANDGKKPESMAPGDLRRVVINEILLGAVLKCGSAEFPVTFAKLRDFVPLDAEMVAANGGLDGVVDMDPDGPDAETARENIVFFLNACEQFSVWASSACRDLSRFQGKEWEDRVKNSNRGRDTNTGQTPSSPAKD